MKSLRQLSEEEQREARIADAHRVFMQQMIAIELDYQRNMQRVRRSHRRMMLLITTATTLAILLPTLAFVWRIL